MTIPRCEDCKTPLADETIVLEMPSRRLGPIEEAKDPEGRQVLHTDRRCMLALRGAIALSGFRVSRALLGELILWCLECDRDSGYHLASCSKANRANNP